MKSPFLTIEESKNRGNIPQDSHYGSKYISQKPIIEVDGLRVIYFPGKSNEAKVLNGISLEIYPEEYVIFFGPSGSGKSTLLNIIAGLEVPSRGKVIVDGQDLSLLSSNEMAKFHRRKTGMIFQIYNLIPSLKVLDNIILPQIFERIKFSKRKELGRALLKKLGIDELEERLPQELSGGQQQRVGIARALINDPPILLADEATGNLDSESARNVLEIFNLLNTEYKKTIVFVTHNPEHLFYADRIFYMKDGKIIKVEINHEKRKIRGESEEGGIKKERTELDLLLQAYPDLSAMQLQSMLAPFKAKMLTAYLLSNLDIGEINLLEQIITQRLLDAITKEELFRVLDAPAEEGGVGLNRNTALKFSSVIEKVVAKSDFLKQKSPYLKDSQAEPIRQSIDEIRKTLLDKYEGELTLGQVEALDKGIEYRLLSKVSKREFQEYLDYPFEKGGVGLNKRTARNLAKELEIIMLLKFSG